MSDPLHEIEAAIAEIKHRGNVGDTVSDRRERSTARSDTKDRDQQDYRRRDHGDKVEGTRRRRRSNDRKHDRERKPEKHRRQRSRTRHERRHRHSRKKRSRSRKSHHRRRHRHRSSSARRARKSSRRTSRSPSLDPRIIEAVRSRVAASQATQPAPVVAPPPVAGTDAQSAPNDGALGSITMLPAHTKPYRELYISGFPKGISTQALHEFLNGIIAHYHIVTTPNPVVRVNISSDGSYAFIEVRSIEEADICLISLEGLPCATGTLKVGRPKNYPGPPPASLLAASATSSASLGIGLKTAEEMANKLEEAAASIGKPSPVIELLNTICDADLSSPTEIEDVRNDITQECGKYGTVLSVSLPSKGEVPLAVYVQFANADEAFAAIEKLTGRTFDGRSISAKYFPVDDYSAVVEEREAMLSKSVSEQAGVDTSVD